MGKSAPGKAEHGEESDGCVCGVAGGKLSRRDTKETVHSVREIETDKTSMKVCPQNWPRASSRVFQHTQLCVCACVCGQEGNLRNVVIKERV